MEPRSAAEVGKDFPYTSPTVCYIEVWQDGQVTHGTDRDTYQRAMRGESRLFAVWPGQWSSHLFVIDDLDEYARAVGLKHDQKRTGLADHTHDLHYEIERDDNPRSPYVTIRITFDCGCEIKDRGAFAKQMREQRGWDVATSGGWGSSRGSGGATFSLRVRRKSLAAETRQPAARPDDECPGTGQQGIMDESAPGDEWYVICHVCGTKWAGGSTVLEPHRDRRRAETPPSVA